MNPEELATTSTTTNVGNTNNKTQEIATMSLIIETQTKDIPKKPNVSKNATANTKTDTNLTQKQPFPKTAENANANKTQSTTSTNKMAGDQNDIKNKKRRSNRLSKVLTNTLHNSDKILDACVYTRQLENPKPSTRMRNKPVILKTSCKMIEKC